MAARRIRERTGGGRHLHTQGVLSGCLVVHGGMGHLTQGSSMSHPGGSVPDAPIAHRGVALSDTWQYCPTPFNNTAWTNLTALYGGWHAKYWKYTLPQGVTAISTLDQNYWESTPSITKTGANQYLTLPGWPNMEADSGLPQPIDLYFAEYNLVGGWFPTCEGTHTFYLSGDDGCQLFIDGIMVIGEYRFTQ